MIFRKFKVQFIAISLSFLIVAFGFSVKSSAADIIGGTNDIKRVKEGKKIANFSYKVF